MDRFVRADSANLPKMENYMIVEYLCSKDKHNIAEIRGAKILMSSRDSYVDTAVGYVEIKRSTPECTVRAKVVPEHKVSTKQYVVNVTINEHDNEIIDATCDSCAAAAGGCKHSLVVLYWLEKRSNEPSSTSVTCYWKKPILSGVKSDPVLCEDIFKNSKKLKLDPKEPTLGSFGSNFSFFLPKFLEKCQTHAVKQSLATCFSNPRTSYNIFDLTVEYLRHNQENFDSYMSFLNNKISENVVKEIKLKTSGQANSKLWHSIRQGRITASKIFEASRCTTDGTLVQQILGGFKVPETEAIKRGKRLENQVVKEVEKQLEKTIHECGFILINGVVGASPDGVAEDFVLEVKCPTSEKTMKKYVLNGEINSKFVAQLQTQMLAAKKTKGVFCVADVEFESNKRFNLYYLNYDVAYTLDLIKKSLSFWETYIYKKIINSART